MNFPCLLLVLMLFLSTASAQLNIYGPGGPAPAMKEAAAVFERSEGVKVNVTSGPMSDWIEKARTDADLIYSGSEHMMTDFVYAMNGLIKQEEVQPLFLRPSAVLVRPGNPENINGFRDLLKDDIKILVVNGAGQTGLWEDIAGKNGDIEELKSFRKNIVFYAKNSAEAKKKWNEENQIDAWLIWNIWHFSDPKNSELVNLEPEYTLYRDCAVVLTEKGKNNKASEFVKLLNSAEGKAIFSKWGWKVD
jgi:accessory colonization factor AcfC